MQLDTKIGDLKGSKGVLELVVSDKKRLPNMNKGGSFSRVGSHIATESLLDPAKTLDLCGDLPIVEKMAAKGGIQTLVSSALSKLKCEY